MMRFRRWLAALCGVLCVSFHAWGDVRKAASQLADTTDFVRVSLVVSAPSGGALYSTLGHATLRMECPTHGMDYCFSSEIAQPMDEVWGFLAGKARVGLVVVRISDYVAAQKAERRKVTGYPLNLTAEEKRELWRLLDGKVAEGLYMTYDYLNRGCGLEVVSFVDCALARERIVYGRLPEWVHGSRREIACRALEPFPWTRVFMMLMMGDEADREVALEKRVMVPADIVEVWSDASIEDTAGCRRPLLAGAPEVLYDPGADAVPSSRFPGPLAVFGAVLLMTVLLTVAQWRHAGSWRRCGRVADAVLFAVQALAGLFMTFLWWCSDLVATGWNKYHVVLNILPLAVYVWGRVRPFAPDVWRKVYGFYGLVLAGFIVSCAWQPCPDYPLWCLFGAMAVRCFYHASIKKKERINNHKSNPKKKKQ